MPVQFRTMKELKEKTPDVVKATKQGDVVITLRGKPTAVLHRFSEAELEATLFAESKRVKKLLKNALEDVRAGRTVPLEALLAKISASA